MNVRGNPFLNSNCWNEWAIREADERKRTSCVMLLLVFVISFPLVPFKVT